MNEPNLHDINDYDSLEGEKRKVVIAVILAGLVIGVIYTIAYTIYDEPDDTLEVQGSFKQVPMR